MEEKNENSKRNVFDFIGRKEDFSADAPHMEKSKLYFKEIEFFENGGCVNLYGGETVGGDNTQTWTKGYVLRK